MKITQNLLQNDVVFGLDRTERGITLIALVITIIIMLILVGITISVVNNSGLVAKADYATIITREKAAEEELEMAIVEVKMDKLWKSNLSDLLAEFKKDGRHDIEVIDVVSSGVSYVKKDYAIPEGTPTEITVIVTKYPEFEFTLGQACTITKISGVDYSDWKEEHQENNNDEPQQEEQTQITITATPSSQTANYVETQDVLITATCNKNWGEYGGKYAWSTSNEEEPTSWTTLSLNDGSTTKQKTSSVVNFEEYDGSYYLWIQIIAAGKTETECFGPYNFQETPTMANLVCVLDSKSDHDTKGIAKVGTTKAFDGWSCSYTLNRGQKIAIENGTTIDVNVVKKDYIEVYYEKNGFTAVITDLDLSTEGGLKIAYTLNYDLDGGSGGPESQTKYDITTFTIGSEVPTKSGYDFVNWKDVSGNTYNPNGSITISNGTSKTLIAQWQTEYSLTTINTLVTRENSTITGRNPAYNNPVIPVGFKAVNTVDAVWTDSNSDGKPDGWNDGLVIQDESGNEFVWVPVDGTNVKYEKWCTKNIAWNDSNIDNVPSTELPTGVNENTQITMYQGFYLGRYEAGTPDGTVDTRTNDYGIPLVQRNKIAWTNLDYNHANTNAKLLFDNEYLKSGLLTGTMWDTVCKWIDNTGIYDADDSSTWGNYTISSSPANITGSGTKQSTGYSEYWKAKNIYDFAGNVYEFTNETYGLNRIERGGAYGGNGSVHQPLGNLNRFFIIGIIIPINLKKIKRIYKIFVRKYFNNLKEMDKENKMFSKTGKFLELKGSCFDRNMKIKFLKFFCEIIY